MPVTFTPSHRGGAGPPMVCIHGFTDTWRTWELVLPELERHHDVLAPTLTGHAGGPALAALTTETIADGVERAMDEAGFDTAHLVGNSLGGYVALQLAQRGRARSVVALAPAGGWAEDDASFRAVLESFPKMQRQLQAVLPQLGIVLATAAGRRMATQLLVSECDHIPLELLEHILRGAAACPAVAPMVEFALAEGYGLEPERITCPLRIVWGTGDRVLEWPAAAVRFREALPTADWVELDGAGHCPQLDRPTEVAQLILGATCRADASG